MKGAFLIGATASLLWSWWPAQAAAETGPRQTIEAADQRIRQLLAVQAPSGSAEAARRDEQLGEVVGELLDLDQMAHDALGRYWDRLSPPERREYRELLGQLVEQAYLGQVRAHVAYQLQFGEISVDRDQAWVETLVVLTSDPRGPTFQVVFDMTRRDGRWRVREIVSDGVHLVGSYRVQFTRLIRHRGFAELLRRMRERLGQGTPATSTP